MHLKLWPLAIAAGLGIVDGLTTRDPTPPQQNDADDDDDYAAFYERVRRMPGYYDGLAYELWTRDHPV